MMICRARFLRRGCLSTCFCLLRASCGGHGRGQVAGVWLHYCLMGGGGGLRLVCDGRSRPVGQADGVCPPAKRSPCRALQPPFCFLGLLFLSVFPCFCTWALGALLRNVLPCRARGHVLRCKRSAFGRRKVTCRKALCASALRRGAQKSGAGRGCCGGKCVTLRLPAARCLGAEERKEG